MRAELSLTLLALVSFLRRRRGERGVRDAKGGGVLVRREAKGGGSG